jgi:hypothetical protein
MLSMPFLLSFKEYREFIQQLVLFGVHSAEWSGYFLDETNQQTIISAPVSLHQLESCFEHAKQRRHTFFSRPWEEKTRSVTPEYKNSADFIGLK